MLVTLNFFKNFFSAENERSLSVIYHNSQILIFHEVIRPRNIGQFGGPKYIISRDFMGILFQEIK